MNDKDALHFLFPGHWAKPAPSGLGQPQLPCQREGPQPRRGQQRASQVGQRQLHLQGATGGGLQLAEEPGTK